MDATLLPWNPGGAVAGATTCVIVTDTGSGFPGSISTGVPITGSGISGTTNGSIMTSPAFTALPGQTLNFNFMFFTNDGSSFSDWGRASLVNPTTGTTLDLFTARTSSNSQVVPGFGFPSFPPELSLSPGVATLQGDTFFIPMFGNTQYGPGRYGGGPGGSSDWNHALFTFDAATAGDWQLAMTVANVGDQIYSSGLAFSGASIGGQVVVPPTNVPEPPALVLFGLGLATLLLLRRKHV